VWANGSSFVQVTVPPALTVIGSGENAKSAILAVTAVACGPAAPVAGPAEGLPEESEDDELPVLAAEVTAPTAITIVISVAAPKATLAGVPT